MRLLIATTNLHKLGEYRDLLKDLPYQAVSLRDMGVTTDVAETGTTFRENACIKAEAYAGLSGLLTLADDSGLAVDALGGRPGVWSARYGGPHATPAEQHRLLLQELADVPWAQRTAQFVCGIAIAFIGAPTQYVEAQLPGLISFAPRGHGGFGYDPLFWLPEQGCTMAELAERSDAGKNQISHRALAARQARNVLLNGIVSQKERLNQ